MNVHDATRERLEERPGVNSVVTRIDDELHAVRPEEVTHGRIAIILGREPLERQLAQRDVALAGECGSAARRPVGGYSDDLEAVIHEVAEIGAFPGNRYTQFQLITTRSPPVCATTSPTTWALRGTSSRSTTRIMPRPM